MKGEVVSIQIASTAGGDLVSLQQAELVAGKGIVADRNYREDGAEPDEELTLVEAEAVAQFNAQTGLNVGAAETRRNIVTCRVSLNDLVGQTFMIGGVKVQGMRLCQPCKYLGDLLATQDVAAPDVVAALVDRAGLRARILDGGTVRVGDAVGPDSTR